MKISPLKQQRLARLSTSSGIIAALAIDQRKSLRLMMAEAAGLDIHEIPDARLSEFKHAVTRALTPETSAVLLDPEYGLAAAEARDPNCGLLLAYEMDGYENPRPFKMLALSPRYAVRRLRDLGADGIKILLTYTPFDDEAANDQKCALIERIGAECDALDMPFFLEPVGYSPEGLATTSFEYARHKPEIVLRSMEEFSKGLYRVDVLKVEFPVNAAYVEGSAVYTGQRAYTKAEALEHYRAADDAAGRPYIYLSAGVSSEQFIDQLGMAAESGARFSGVLCGRATWKEGAGIYARGGLRALEPWLASEGTRKIKSVNDCLKQAKPWTEWI